MRRTGSDYNREFWTYFSTVHLYSTTVMLHLDGILITAHAQIRSENLEQL
ncbi:MAG TPA: hypothetical protein V6D15_06780 [Oculatellaceae cyanobacterium]